MKTKTQLSADPRLAEKTKLNINLILLILTAISAVFLLAKTTYATGISETTLVELVNQERTMRGLNILKVDPKLYFAAKSKALDMISKQYFEHYTPDGKSPWDFIHGANYDYQMAGENLAMDFKTSEGVHSAWMASSSHKDNIIKPDYEDIAIAISRGEFNGKQTTMIVEMFGKQFSKTKSLGIGGLISSIYNFILGF